MHTKGKMRKIDGAQKRQRKDDDKTKMKWNNKIERAQRSIENRQQQRARTHTAMIIINKPNTISWKI